MRIPLQKRDVLVLSVEHSGTRFITNHLLLGKANVTHFHSMPGYEDKSLWYAETVPVVIPMRHPRSVAISWVARGRTLEQLHDEWRILFSLVERMDRRPIYLPIDVPLRRWWLWKMRFRLLMLTLRTKWKPVGSCRKTAILTVEQELEVRQMYREHKHYFKKFGYWI